MNIIEAHVSIIIADDNSYEVVVRTSSLGKAPLCTDEMREEALAKLHDKLWMFDPTHPGDAIAVGMPEPKESDHVEPPSDVEITAFYDDLNSGDVA